MIVLRQNNYSITGAIISSAAGLIFAGLNKGLNNYCSKVSNKDYRTDRSKILDYINTKYKNSLLVGSMNGVSSCFIDPFSKSNQGMARDILSCPKNELGAVFNLTNPENDEDWLIKAILDKKQLILTEENSSIAVISHELGHFLYEQTETGKVVQGEKYDTGIHNKNFITFVAGLLGATGNYGMVAAPIASLLLGYPTYYSEFKASWYGYGVLRNVLKVPEKDLETAKKELMAAYGTYISANLSAPLAMAGIGGSIRNKFV